MPDPRDAIAWQTYLSHLQDAAAERVRAETTRLEAAGVIDARGGLLDPAVPVDMAEGSRSSVTTG